MFYILNPNFLPCVALKKFLSLLLQKCSFSFWASFYLSTPFQEEAFLIPYTSKSRYESSSWQLTQFLTAYQGKEALCLLHSVFSRSFNTIALLPGEQIGPASHSMAQWQHPLLYTLNARKNMAQFVWFCIYNPKANYLPNWG